jgi:hypothetical protein
MASHKPLLFLALLMALLTSPLACAVCASPITVTTDKASYSTGQTVVISGSATADAVVTVQVVNPAGTTIFTDVVTATSAGVFTTSFKLPQDAVTGTYTVYASATEGSNTRSFTVTAAAPTPTAALSVAVDGGTIYFPGETAEFYILVSYNGAPVEANVSTMLYGPTEVPVTKTEVATGLYKVVLTIPDDAQAGTYAIVVNASSATYVGGVSLKSFQISPTLTDLNARLISINGTVAEIKTNIGTIKANLTDINTKITSIEGDVATIETDIGTIKANISALKTDLSTIKGYFPVTVDMTPVWVAVIMSLIAAIAAIATVIQISRKIAG